MSTETIPQNGGARDTRWWERVNRSDLVITLVLVGIFVGAFVLASSFRSLAAYFPLGVSGLGIIGSLSFLVRVVLFPRSPDAPKGALPDGAQSFSDSEYEFFRGLSRRDWIVASAWLAGFYLALGIAGIYVAAAVFTVAYLRVAVKRTWLFSLAYAAALTALVWVIFKVVLALPLPRGALGVS